LRTDTIGQYDSSEGVNVTMLSWLDRRSKVLAASRPIMRRCTMAGKLHLMLDDLQWAVATKATKLDLERTSDIAFRVARACGPSGSSDCNSSCA
jgi:hypothetical protein